MEAVGTYSYEKVSNRIDDFEPMTDDDIVERGEAYKRFVFKDEVGSIDEILLGPNSKIRLHEHSKDFEIYFNWFDGNAELCQKGCKHYLENKSSDLWLIVFAVKRNK